MRVRVVASRHSAFYSPLLCCVLRLREAGHDAPYRVMQPGQRSYALIGAGEVDVMQSAVSSNWGARELGIEELPVHFAQINQRDGFFLAGRAADAAFDWKGLEGRTLLADHELQPLVMLKYAVRLNRADWEKIHVVDAGSPAEMEAAFAAGRGDYVHLQGPVPPGHIAAAVGSMVPPVAFSSLCCSRSYQETAEYGVFVKTYECAREWVRTAAPEEVAAYEAGFFPSIRAGVLVDAIRRYQALGCWLGGMDISRELYEQALNVFHAAGAIAWRHTYSDDVG